MGSYTKVHNNIKQSEMRLALYEIFDRFSAHNIAGQKSSYAFKFYLEDEDKYVPLDRDKINIEFLQYNSGAYAHFDFNDFGHYLPAILAASYESNSIDPFIYDIIFDIFVPVKNCHLYWHGLIL